MGTETVRRGILTGQVSGLVGQRAETIFIILLEDPQKKKHNKPFTSSGQVDELFKLPGCIKDNKKF